MAEEQLDPEIIKIEDDIIQFLDTYPLFLGQNPIHSTIKAYFITRKDLTQKKLKNLTGFSSGTISQVLREFLELNIIEKSDISNKGEITYTLKSIELAFISSYIDINSEILNWENELLQIKSEMDLNKDEFIILNGYRKIKTWVSLLLRIFPFAKLVLEMLEKEKDNLENFYLDL